MAMPQDVLSSQVIQAAFEPPRTDTKLNLEDYDYGPVAVGDASEGLRVRVWRGFVDGNNIKVEAPGVPAATIFTYSAVTELAFTFDQNGRPFFAFVSAGAAFIRWYDSTIEDFTITALPAGAANPRCQLDDKRFSQTNSSDILLIYVRAGNLCMRRQRDRYTIEYVLANSLPSGRLVQVGMNVVNRFQCMYQPGY